MITNRGVSLALLSAVTIGAITGSRHRVSALLGIITCLVALVIFINY